MPLRISLGQLLHDCATRFGERPCITMAPSGETLSYAGLESLVNRAAHGFRDGIAGGRLSAGSGHVAVMLENGIPYLAMSWVLNLPSKGPSHTIRRNSVGYVQFVVLRAGYAAMS